MTNRSPVSSVQNIWFDAEQVDAQALSLEQTYNNQIQSSLINNHIGSGVLPETLEPRILFDTSNCVGLLDGVVINSTTQPLIQPSDNNYGNQLEIQLSNSDVAGRRSVKVAIVGLDFEQNLQYETFVFKVNESQFTKKHYTAILQILINDFSGDANVSFNLGGRIIIREAAQFTMSRDTLMVSQNMQPNLFFRDFFTVAYSNNYKNLLVAGLPLYDPTTLDISPEELGFQSLPVNNVTRQIGQKFLATTNNIQKITLLLQESSGSDDWSGDLVVSVYPLQTSLQCPTDIPPNSLLNFSPTASPLAQISVTKVGLAAKGVKLNDVSFQPVDFEFSNTSISNGNFITPGNYYAFTVKRAGNASVGEIRLPTGNKIVEDSVMTIFDGSTWADDSTQDLWFEIHTDSVKVTDGQAYNTGSGVQLTKVTQDPDTGSTVDYCLHDIYFSGTDTFTGVLFAATESNTPVQDLRTGNAVYSRQQIKPQIQLLSTLELNSLKETSDPLQIGNVADKNIRFIDENPFTTYLNSFSLKSNELFFKILDASSYGTVDASNTQLRDLVLNGKLLGATVYPNYVLTPSKSYRVAKAEVIQMLYGDVNGDGIVDQTDLDLLRTYRDFSFSQLPPLNSSITTSPTTTTFTNGYNSYINPFSSQTGVHFRIVDSSDNNIDYAGTSVADGYFTPDPLDPRVARFSSLYDFSSLPSIYLAPGGYKLVTLDGNDENSGGFEIIGSGTYGGYKYLTVRKIYIDETTIGQIFRSDITDDYQITSLDEQIVEAYVDKSIFLPASPVDGYANIIGKPFSVVKLVLEQYESNGIVTDRTDDYCSNFTTRNADIHTIYDVFKQDSNLASQLSPTLRFEAQLIWKDYLVTTNSLNKLVTAVFPYDNAAPIFPNQLIGESIETYWEPQPFNPGRNDLLAPSNVVINHGGELLRPNGDFYKVDFEVGTVILEIPSDPTLDGYKTFNIFSLFVAEDIQGTGLTSKGYPAMRFADHSFVDNDAMSKNQVRYSVAIQSYSPKIETIVDGMSAVIVDGKIGVSIDQSTSILTINFSNLFTDPIHPTDDTKIQIHVFLKKAGFNNTPLFVPAAHLYNLAT